MNSSNRPPAGMTRSGNGCLVPFPHSSGLLANPVNSTATHSSPARSAAARGWVFYDGQCPLCLAAVARWEPVFGPQGFQFVPLQEEWVRHRLGMRPGQLPGEMKLLTPDDQLIGGPDVAAALGRTVWWTWPAAVVSRWSIIRWGVDAGYRWVAANRRCLGDLCRLPAAPRTRHHAATTFFELP
ncbi:MAG: DUF393 domain-containing protein [Pedosphaera sp.]|nr:DUF393 domain-containing protein [Pedosphaera sp.]